MPERDPLARKTVTEVRRSIERDYGEEAVILGSQMVKRQIHRMTTGVLSYDAALGGGWPVGHWSEIIGNESNGKTLLVQATIIANQLVDPKFTTLWIAGEAVNFAWCQTLGMDLNRVEFAPGNNMEQALEISLRYMQGRMVDLVVIDSLPALIPTSEDERDFEETTIGRAALLNNKYFLRKAPTAMRRSLTKADRPCTGLVVNQWREKIGTMGDPRTTPGGKGKNFAFFVRVDMTRTEWLKDSKRVVGGRFRMRTVKNKTAPVNRVAEISFYFDDTPGFPAGSFDLVGDLIDTGMFYDVFGTGGGGVYSFGEYKWKGRERLTAAVREDLDLQREIRDAVIHIVNPDAGRRRIKIVPSK